MYVLLRKYWIAEHQESSHATVQAHCSLLPASRPNPETDVALYCSLSGLFLESNEFLFLIKKKKSQTHFLFATTIVKLQTDFLQAS